MIKNINVFIFQGNNSTFSSAVFSSFEEANIWIKSNNLNGILTMYPLDYPIYDWAIDNGYFKVKNDLQKSPKFIASFSCAYQKHWHFVDGFSEE